MGKLTMTAQSVGENAVIFYLPEPVQADYPAILQRLSQAAKSIGVVDYVAAYHSLLVVFDPKTHNVGRLTERLQQQLTHVVDGIKLDEEQRLIHVPVCYEGDFSPDLTELADNAEISTAEVIKRHSDRIYTVCCLGFIPGFAFLGYVDDAIATPRRAEPRAKIPAGSVGIAGRQTGIYPADSPGGWQIIGRTPMTLYAPERGLYSRFAMGDRVQFYVISRDEFNAWRDDV